MRTKDPAKAKQIRTKALEMVLAQGLDGFSMQKLARSAGVSPATLYIHFKDREDLIFQLYKEQMLALSRAVLEGFNPSMPFAEGLRLQWRNRIEFCRDNPAGWSFLEQIMHSPYHKDFAARVGATFRDAMATFVRHAIAAGELTSFGLPASQLDEFPTDLYWSLAFAPLYELLRCQQGRGGPGPRRKKQQSLPCDDKCIDQAFECVAFRRRETAQVSWATASVRTERRGCIRDSRVD